MKQPSLMVIFLTVFVDLIGFGIALPLLPIYSEQFGASDLMVGVVIASFSLMQFLFAPSWGRLSDRIGRRPVLLISNFGSTASYAMFALASGLSDPKLALWCILASRVFAGLCGANLGVASAYIADISPPEKRSKNMGLIGMAFGLGFIFGPALGAFAYRHFGLPGPGWFAAGVCAVNFCLTWSILGESRKPGGTATTPRPKLEQWAHTLRQPTVGLLIVIYFLATYCFASFESTFSRLVHRRNENAEEFIGYLFTYCGVLAAVVQGGLIGRLVKRFGEARLIFGSLVLFAVGLAMLPVMPSIGLMVFALGLVAVGSGINRPPTFGLISMNTPADEQGATLGVAQAAGSLARILAPISANLLYRVNVALPYFFCSAIALAVALVAWKKLCASPAPAPAASPAA